MLQPAICSLVCPDVLIGIFRQHGPFFFGADNIMYLSASYIPLPSSKHAIISSQLTLSSTSNLFQCSLQSKITSPLVSCCCMSLRFHSRCIRIPKPYLTCILEFASHPYGSYAYWSLFSVASSNIHIHYNPPSASPDKNTNNTEYL